MGVNNLIPQASDVSEIVCHGQGTSQRFRIGQSGPPPYTTTTTKSTSITATIDFFTKNPIDFPHTSKPKCRFNPNSQNQLKITLIYNQKPNSQTQNYTPNYSNIYHMVHTSYMNI